jgi:hypothetical protein
VTHLVTQSHKGQYTRYVYTKAEVLLKLLGLNIISKYESDIFERHPSLEI